jgi:TonB-linked SusC/RagA family outer membrane protein
MKKNYLTLVLTLMWSALSFAQTTVSGIITDSNSGEALIAATVLVKNSNTGAISDIEGRYTIEIPEGATTLVISYTGYGTQEIEINGRSVVDIQLTEGVDIGEELVVVGYGTQKKSSVTGAISQVKGKDLEDMQVPRIEQALQGRTSGVRITQSSGAPGSGSTIRIRGTSSLGGSNPLFVVDGVVIGGGIDFLNPNDIESIEVLKDAASAAIYGARGANGVIIVTTKKGVKGKMRVNYSGFYGVQNPWKKIPLLNAREYATIQNEMTAAEGKDTLRHTNVDQLGEGTDWQDAVFNNNASIISNEFSVAGGTEKMTYYSSMNYFQQEGIVAEGKSNYSRLTARLNVESQVNKRFKYGTNVAYTHTESRGVADNTEFGSPLGRALNIDPLTPVYEDDLSKLAMSPYTSGGELRTDLVEDENGIFGISDLVTSEIVNPVAASEIINSLGWADKFVTSIYGEYEIIKNLKVRSSFGGDFAFYGGNNFTPVYYLNATNGQDTNSVAVNINSNFTWIWDNTISYDFSLRGNDHRFTVLAGHSAQATKGNYLSGSQRDIPSQDPQDATIDYARNQDSRQVGGGIWEHYAIESYFSRMTYNYKGKYLLTAIMRADASTRFGTNNRWGYFPSVSAGWNVNDEDFWTKNEIVNSLKVRAGWGRNGNDNAGSLEYISTVGGGSNYTFGTGDVLTNGVVPTQISNLDLRWETVEQLNIGVDVSFLGNFNMTLDYFIQNTLDMKTVAPIPAYVGNNPATSNVGDMTNTGVDMELGYAGSFNDVNLNIRGNVSYIKNEVVNIGNEAGFVQGSTWGPQGLEVTRTSDGLPIGYLFGYVTDGIFQNAAEVAAHTGVDGSLLQPDAVPGDFRFSDVNGDGVFNEDDRTIIGDPTPTWTYGFTVDVTYKGFDVVLFGQGVGGNDIFNATRRYDLSSSNMNAAALGRWTGEGSSTDYPRLTNDDTNINFARSSTFYVESGAFFRIKSAQFGYTLPRELTSKAGIGKARIYVASNNLLTITNYSGFDPEIGSGIDRGIYPQARTVSFGLNVTFE